MNVQEYYKEPAVWPTQSSAKLGYKRSLSEKEIQSVQGGVAHVGIGIAVGAISGGVSSYMSGGNAGQIIGAAVIGGVAGLWGATGGVIQIVNAAAVTTMTSLGWGGHSGRPRPRVA
jgi:hypothetical protein